MGRCDACTRARPLMPRERSGRVPAGAPPSGASWGTQSDPSSCAKVPARNSLTEVQAEIHTVPRHTRSDHCGSLPSVSRCGAVRFCQPRTIRISQPKQAAICAGRRSREFPLLQADAGGGEADGFPSSMGVSNSFPGLCSSPCGAQPYRPPDAAQPISAFESVEEVTCMHRGAGNWRTSRRSYSGPLPLRFSVCRFVGKARRQQ